jgi:alkanesulfonate monooxygenase SsuD/methylene tetrahydromethanopterin reductase-like flavin-dependent oxidoreductase (luciferase family)
MMTSTHAVHPTAPRLRPLKIGLFLPYAERQMDGQTARWADLLTMARRAEEAGFDSLWLADHLVFRHEQASGPWECWTILAALAAVTRRIELGTLVLCTGFRNPALLAKMADTFDEVSDGRLILGLGAGYHEPEHAAFGYPFDHRASRFAEALTIIHTLLREGRINFKGTYYQARECELRPRGPRPYGPPILIGTKGSRMLSLTARYADAWNVWLIYGGNVLEEAAPFLAAVDAACQEANRDPRTLARTAAVLVTPLNRQDEPPGLNRPPGAVPIPISGSPQLIAETLRTFAGAGISHVQVYLHPNSLAGIEAFTPVLEELDRD